MEPTKPQVPQPVQAAQSAVSDVVKQFPKKDFKSLAPYITAAILVVLLGVGTGWVLSGRTLGVSSQTAPGAKTGPKEAGLGDTKTFRDTATGVLKEGGVNGEGTHHLERDGGPSQNVYLTSTVIDLQSFVGKKVQLWGETIKGKKAGWLMDVGKVRVLE